MHTFLEQTITVVLSFGFVKILVGNIFFLFALFTQYTTAVHYAKTVLGESVLGFDAFEIVLFGFFETDRHAVSLQITVSNEIVSLGIGLRSLDCKF